MFLIPANTKRSMLIFGIFNKIDIIIFSIGVGISILLLMGMELSSTVEAAIAVTPGLVVCFLVIPIPNYHNMLGALNSIFKFLLDRRKFIWKGWSFIYGKEK